MKTFITYDAGEFFNRNKRKGEKRKTLANDNAFKRFCSSLSTESLRKRTSRLPRKNRQSCKMIRAFTLTEMLMVLAIIGILLMLVLPNQASTVAQAKAIEAQQNLNHLFALEKNYFFMHSKYSPSLDEVGFEQLLLVTEGGQAKYKISIMEASATNFIGQAEAVVDFDGDGQFNVWTIDQNQLLQETTRD